MRWIGAMGLLLVGCGQRPVPDGQRCVVEAEDRWCAHETERLSWGLMAGRKVHLQVPVGTPPSEGWPVAILFQGSLHPASMFWEAQRDDAFGGWHQVGVVDALLASGWAVVTPNAQGAGRGFWNTNVAAWALVWEQSPDHKMMTSLLEALDAEELGPLDPDRLVAGGISSGGYMASRMALSYPGRFDRLVIQSASWATCSGPVCVLPGGLPEDHPPTLFLHGEDDDVVPVATMARYAEQLVEEGHEVRVITDPDVGHAWLEAAPEEVVAWVDEG